MLIRNISLNLLAKIFTSFSSILFVPFYLSMLGQQDFAVILFITTVVSIFSIFDFGLSQTFAREIGGSKFDKKMFAILETTIFIVLTLLFLFCILIIFFYSEQLEITFPEVFKFLVYAPFVLISQILFNFYTNANFMKKDQTQPNLIAISHVVFRQGFILIPIFLLPRVDVFLIWYLGINIIFAFFSRELLKNNFNLYRKKFTLFDLKKFIQSRISIIMPLFLVSLINVALTQFDKVFISVSNFEIFQHYTYGSLLASAISITSGAITLGFFSRIYEDQDLSDVKSSSENFYKIFFTLYLLICPMALYMYFNSLDILSIWLRDPVLAQNSHPYFSFLILANLAMLIQFPLYQILIAKGVPKYNLYFGLGCVGVILPTYYYLSSNGLFIEIAKFYLFLQSILSVSYSILCFRILKLKINIIKLVIIPSSYVLLFALTYHLLNNFIKNDEYLLLYCVPVYILCFLSYLIYVRRYYGF